VIPVLLFVVACALSSVGPGAISTVALLAPLAMAVGQRVGVSPFLIALMVANGANAGNLSPFSSVGVIANGAMAKAGLTGHEALVWFANFAAHVVVGCRGQTGVRRGSDGGQTGVRPGSDRGQTRQARSGGSDPGLTPV
jgi:Na+/H+ antiporter NhaD/arsenite permease-like protein